GGWGGRAGRVVNEAWEEKIDWGPAISAIETDGRAVRDDELVVDGNVGHLVTAVRSGVHAIEGGRLGRANVSAHVRGVLESQSCELAVLRERGRNRSQAIARGGRRRKMLGAIFDPLDGHARLAADGREKNDVRENRLLDAETP